MSEESPCLLLAIPEKSNVSESTPLGELEGAFLFSFASSATAFAATLAAASAATATVAATTATAFAGNHFQDALNLVIRGFAALNDFALEVQFLACQGVVEVDDDVLLADTLDEAVETLALGILQGHDSSLVDVFAVNLAVNLKDAARHLLHKVGVVLAVALLDGEGEVERVARIQGDDLCLEGVERNTQSRNEHVGIFSGCRLDALSLTTLDGSQLIGYSDVFVGFHCLVMICSY